MQIPPSAYRRNPINDEHDINHNIVNATVGSENMILEAATIQSSSILPRDYGKVFRAHAEDSILVYLGGGVFREILIEES